MLGFENYGRDLRVYFFVGLLFSLQCCAGAQEQSARVPADAQNLFFPKSDKNWERLTPAEANWDEAALKNLLQYAGEQK